MCVSRIQFIVLQFSVIVNNYTKYPTEDLFYCKSCFYQMSINAELDIIRKLKVEPLHSASSTSGKDNKMFSKSMRLVGLFSAYINRVELLV